MKSGLRGGAGPGPGTAARLPAGLATFVAFEAALDMIPQPTFVIDRGGRILHANALGAELLAQRGDGVRRSLVQAAGGQSAELPCWRLTTLGSARSSPGFIAVLEASEPRAGATSPSAVVSRWKLTARQAQVLELVAGGATNAAIAETLGIKERTVEFHLSAIFDKAGVDNRATLIARLVAP